MNTSLLATRAFSPEDAGRLIACIGHATHRPAFMGGKAVEAFLGSATAMGMQAVVYAREAGVPYQGIIAVMQGNQVVHVDPDFRDHAPVRAHLETLSAAPVARLAIAS